MISLASSSASDPDSMFRSFRRLFLPADRHSTTGNRPGRRTDTADVNPHSDRPVVLAVILDGPDARAVAERAAVETRRRDARMILAVPVRGLAGLTTDPAVILATYRRQAIEAAAIAARAEPALAAAGVRAEVIPIPIRGERWRRWNSARLVDLARGATVSGGITLVWPEALSAPAYNAPLPGRGVPPIQVLVVPSAASTSPPASANSAAVASRAASTATGAHLVATKESTSPEVSVPRSAPLVAGQVINIAHGANGRSGVSTIAVYNASLNKTIIYLHSRPLSSLSVGRTVSRNQQIATEAWRGGAMATHQQHSDA